MHNLDICIIAAEQDLPRLENTLKTIPKFDNIYILENTRSENGEEKIELVHSTGKIHHYRWHWTGDAFHFADARNKCFGLSNAEWIFWLDCDDSISSSDCRWIDDNLLTLDDNVGGIMFCCSGLVRFEGYEIWEFKEVEGIASDNWGYWSSPTIRLLKRSCANWQGRVHEQVIDSIVKNGKSLMVSDLGIKHRGYVITIDDYIKKMERNIALLKLQLDESDFLEGIYMTYLDSSQNCVKQLKELRDKKCSNSA